MAIATAPNSCSYRDQLGRDWVIQLKPVGAAPEEYQFLMGLTSLAVNIETSAVDSTTIDANGWSGETKTGRSLTVQADGKFVVDRNLPVLPEVQQLLKVTGEELGGDGQVDIRVWRTDVSEGWEYTATNNYSTSGGDATGLRTFSAGLKSSCEPIRIESVTEGQEKAESVPVDMTEYLAITKPKGTENP